MNLNASLVLYLYQNGYRQKLICLITGYNQSAVSKIVNKKDNCFPSIDNITEEQMLRKYVIDRILECRELPFTNFTDQDTAYIQLLNFLLVDKEKIRKLYYNHPQYKINKALINKRVVKEDFQPELIGLTDEEFQTVIPKICKENEIVI